MQHFSRHFRASRVFMPAALFAALTLAAPILRASPASDADALLAKMTLDEKIGQMTQVDSAALKDKTDVQKYFLGSVLSGGSSDPADNQPQTWRSLVDDLQAQSLQKRLK